MSTSERASVSIRPLPEREQPISEQYRITAKLWVDLDGAARMREATKDVVLSQMVMKYAEAASSMAAAERLAKSSKEWEDFVRDMVKDRTAANLKKVQLEYLKMRHMEETSNNANARAERKL